MDRKYHHIRGFTLVELIMTILLMSILSVVAISRFDGNAGFSAAVAQEQAISIIRQIQLNRMYSNFVSSDENLNLTLVIEEQCIGSQLACSLLPEQAAKRSDVLQADNQLTFSVDPPVKTIHFDSLGRIIMGTDALITLSSAGSCARVRINTQGYVSKESC